MTFEEFWKENYEKQFGTCEPYYGIASYAFEKGQENCNCVHTDNSKVIERLEKKNAELKEQLEMSNKVYNDNLDYSYHIEEQFTKAKEIIRMVIDSYNHKERFSFEKDLRKAETFLKESDNEKA